MGEKALEQFRFSFNRSIRLEARPERLSSDGGTLLIREIDERLRVTRDLAARLIDPRDRDLVIHPLVELLRTSINLIAQGWGDQDDADKLRDDPACRLAVSNRKGDSPLRSPNEGQFTPDGLASQPTLSRMIGTVAIDENREKTRKMLLTSAGRDVRATNSGHRLRYVDLDVDSIPLKVEGHQEGAKYNGHYQCRCYHPLVASIAQTGDMVDMKLREGNVHTADGALDFIMPLIDRLESELCQVACLRCDAGFPEPKVLAALEERRLPVPYVFRIKKNAVLDRLAAPYLTRPKGRRPNHARTWFGELEYQAESWSRPRRIVLVVVDEPDELFPRHFFLLTGYTIDQLTARELLEHYRQRGTAEMRQGEFKDVLDPALSCTQRPKSHYGGRVPKRRYPSGDPMARNEATLLLHALAYNLMNAARRLMSRATGQGVSLRRFREQALKVAARFCLTGNRVVMVIAKSAAPIWSGILRLLSRLRFVPEPACLSPTVDTAPG